LELASYYCREYNLSSKFERRIVFSFRVNGEHGTDRRTDGRGVKRNAAS